MPLRVTDGGQAAISLRGAPCAADSSFEPARQRREAQVPATRAAARSRPPREKQISRCAAFIAGYARTVSHVQPQLARGRWSPRARISSLVPVDKSGFL